MVVAYIKDPSYGKYLGEVQINIVEKSFAQNMNLDKALSLIKDYLPENFSTYYKKDAAFIKQWNDIITYSYGTRLSKKGENVRATSNPYMPYFYSFYIKHDTQNNTWEISTDYSAYAGASVEWYNRYKKWNVNLNE